MMPIILNLFQGKFLFHPFHQVILSFVIIHKICLSLLSYIIKNMLLLLLLFLVSVDNRSFVLIAKWM